MNSLSDRFRELEQLCKTEIPADIHHRLQAIDAEMQEVRAAMEAYFNCAFPS
jgi:hypothetical protein